MHESDGWSAHTCNVHTNTQYIMKKKAVMSKDVAVIADLWDWLFLFFSHQGETGPPGPAGPRGMPVSIPSSNQNEQYLFILYKNHVVINKILHQLDLGCSDLKH